VRYTRATNQTSQLADGAAEPIDHLGAIKPPLTDDDHMNVVPHGMALERTIHLGFRHQIGGAGEVMPVPLP